MGMIRKTELMLNVGKENMGENINTLIFHAVASHFVNGLIPVAVFFMLLTLVTA